MNDDIIVNVNIKKIQKKKNEIYQKINKIITSIHGNTEITCWKQ